LRCRERLLDLTRPRVMGILNLTPDSFSDGGRFRRGDRIDPPLVLDVAARMVEQGAAILDVGGESTRPGATPISAAEELDRVMPVLERLRALDVAVSIDTYKASVARAALAEGAHVVNDVTGARDPAMIETVAEAGAAICVMHMRGEPRTMQLDPTYTDVVGEVSAFLHEQTLRCVRAGIGRDRIVVDPGLGFGKTLEHNLALLHDLPALVALRYPVLIGASRKGMIGALTGRSVDRRMPGSLAVAVLAAQRGARLIRTHDVAETVDALAVAHAVLAARQRDGEGPRG
jgi:dihydropteroate synthase